MSFRLKFAATCFATALAPAAQDTRPSRTGPPGVDDVVEIRVRLDRRAPSTFGAPQASPGFGEFTPQLSGEVLTMLRDYHAVGAEVWTRDYSHTLGRDRFGTLRLADDSEWRWFLRPGGLGWLVDPRGAVTHLASVIPDQPPVRRPRPKPALPDIPVAIDGLDAMLRAARADARDRFDVVRNLARGPALPEVVTFLLEVAADTTDDVTTRDHAAGGLSAMSRPPTPAELQTRIGSALRAIVDRERRSTPDGVIRALADAGAADHVLEALGTQLADLPTEMFVLARCSAPAARERLWAIHQTTPHSRHPRDYAIHGEVARALIALRDSRGIDILIALLPRSAAPGPQYAHNNLVFLTQRLGLDFGYHHQNYDPSLDRAVTAATAWWQQNRADFRFE